MISGVTFNYRTNKRAFVSRSSYGYEPQSLKKIEGRVDVIAVLKILTTGFSMNAVANEQ